MQKSWKMQKGEKVANLEYNWAKYFNPHLTQSHNDSQLFIGKKGGVFLKRKSYFLENKTLDQRLGANSKKLFFAQFYSKFATFLLFFSFLAQKTMKITISTSVWGVQHPWAGRNIQLIPLNNVYFRKHFCLFFCIQVMPMQSLRNSITCFKRKLNI